MSNRTTMMVARRFFFTMAMLALCSRGVALDFTNANQNWLFMRADQPAAPIAGIPAEATAAWDENAMEKVNLPHTPRIEPFIACQPWRGVCWYRRHLSLPDGRKGLTFLLDVHAAMIVATVWVNGTPVATHEGGYLPFTVDISSALKDGDNLIAIRLDNRDNAEIPPGRPLKDLDFCWYGGLYRGVSIRAVQPLHISGAMEVNHVGGGGTQVSFPEVDTSRAVVAVRTHIINNLTVTNTCRVELKLFNTAGKLVSSSKGKNHELGAGSGTDDEQRLVVEEPNLWSPQHPALYTLQTSLISDSGVVDQTDTRIGIRRITFSASGGFTINGKRMWLRGTNRHQEYPYIGYALSDNAQYRDALKIKEAGFDFVRCSHYPPSPAFLDACDELGIVVMDAIPGWQHIGGEHFRDLCERNVRDMIRRDRNHPCVVLWETSLNETGMPDDFKARLHHAAHEEQPGDQCFTCGWDTGFDLFIQARQHGNCRRFKNGDQACFISEYGDWEYYAQNAGLKQAEFKDLKKEERNSRQRRCDGERRLIQQAFNFQEAANDNRSTPAVGDGLWVMYDYSRGYAKDIEASGPMDSLRLPKFGYWFFQSQRDASETIPGTALGPMVKIATWWTPESLPNIRVYSNCEEVELSLNGTSLGRKKVERDAASARLQHPPFLFNAGAFTPGTLLATGYIDGKIKATDQVNTPGKPAGLRLRTDVSGRPLAADGADAVFVYAEVVDAAGTVVPVNNMPINFSASGPGVLVGDNPFATEAGVAGILLRSTGHPGTITITATTDDGLKTAFPCLLPVWSKSGARGQARTDGMDASPRATE